MNKVVFITNLPSPYRVNFFNELGKYCDLTVLYERRFSSERDRKWVGTGASNYKEIFLDLIPIGADQSKGNATCEYVRNCHTDFDEIIFTNYVSPSTMKTILWCRLHGVPYCIEYDGGFNKKDEFYKRLLKKLLLGGAKLHMTTCEEHKAYLKGLGIQEEKIQKYPFTSINNSDILNNPIDLSLKNELRAKLGIKEKYVILSVGRYIPCKGFDILINAASQFDKSVGFYIVGGKPTEQYLEMREHNKIEKTLHFVDFMNKNDLKEWYKVADLFVLPTRGDIWGLVINEAMACGLPIVTTDRCIAGLELVHNNENGFIVPVDDVDAICKAMKNTLEHKERMGKKSLEIIGNYTIETMAARHMSVFKENMNIRD